MYIICIYSILVYIIYILKYILIIYLIRNWSTPKVQRNFSLLLKGVCTLFKLCTQLLGVRFCYTCMNLYQPSP